jgi:hypothetical protein
MVPGVAYRSVGPEQIHRVTLFVAEEGNLRDPEVPRGAGKIREDD